MEPLLSTKQVAGLLGWHVKTLQKGIRDNTIGLNFVRLTSRSFGFRPEDVREFIEAREIHRDGTGRAKRKPKKYRMMTDEEAQKFFAGCQRDPEGVILDWPREEN